MDEQNITLKIAGKEYPFKVSSPEMETKMRIAADTINQKLSVFNQRYSDKTLEEKLIFVTLTETVARLTAQKKASEIDEQVKALEGETDSYLNNIEK